MLCLLEDVLSYHFNSIIYCNIVNEYMVCASFGADHDGMIVYIL